MLGMDPALVAGMVLVLLACLVSPASEPVLLSAPIWSAAGDHASASVRTWSRGGESGRLVSVEIAPEAAISVLTTNTPTPLQELLPEGDLVAINGGFYDGAGEAMGLSVSSGRPISPLQQGGGSGVLLLSADGHRIVHRDAVDSLDGVSGAVQSIDRLVAKGRILVSEQASEARDARSAVAVTAAGGLILAVVFAEEAVGRETEADIYLDAESSSSGVTLREWAGLMVRLGGASVLNLDGGFSTSIHIALGEERLDVHPHGATINAVIAR